MSPLEFLAVVLPSPQHGFYCAAELSTAKKEHVFVEDISEIPAPVAFWLVDQKNVFFALSTFEKAGKRTADNARYIRSLFVDMDGYASKKQAALALGAFLADTKLDQFGSPWIVGSGGGLHCYWPFSEDIPIADWKPVAENFKRLCKQEKLAIDMTVTADAARVLRIPGTVNFKKKYPTPRPVELLAEGGVFDFSVVSAHIVGRLTTIPPVAERAPSIDLPGEKPVADPAAPSAVKLFENSATKFKNILAATSAGKGCAQLTHYVENAADDGMEPLWRGWLSIAKVCSDGEKAAIWLSQKHPYDEDRMHAKLRDIKGPYPCIKFDSENPGVCTSCPHFGKITNPLALGRELVLETEAKEVEVIQASENESAPQEIVKVIRPAPPKGFAYGAKGGIFMEKKDKDADGKEITRQIMLLPFDLFVVDLLSNQGVHSVHMYAVKPGEEVRTVLLPQRAVVSKDDTMKMLAEQNVIASFGAGNDQNLFAYIRACVEQASTGRAPLTVPAHYGWQEDESFVFAGRIYTESGNVKVPMPGLENLHAFTQPRGTLEGWQGFINLLIRKKMYKQLAIMMAGAGAPLMRFTGLNGLTFHCGSTESGTGKTLALEAAASIWGHPTHYRMGKNTSAVAMQQRAGLLHSLPVITDEVSTKTRGEDNWIRAWIFDFTEGRGKERMESGSNKERLNLSTWQSCSLLSSNTHFMDLLTTGQHSAEGEIRRLLEFTWNDKLEWLPEEVEIVKSLLENYAVAGPLMVEYMVRNREEVRELVKDCVQKAYKIFNATNDERFWMAGLGTIIAASIIWKRAGIAEIPVQGIIDLYMELIKKTRTTIKGSVRTAEDILNAYTRDNYAKMIIIKYCDERKQLVSSYGFDSKEVDMSITRSSILGRVEHDATPDHVDYYLEEGMLRAYCASMSFGYSDFKRQLAGMFTVTHMPKKNMTAKTKGPQMRVAVIKISRRITTLEDDDEGAVSVGRG